MTQPASPFLQPPPPAAPPPPPPEPPQPSGPQFVGVDATNKLPPEQLTQAFMGGQLGFMPDEHVPVRFPNGKIGTVPAHQAQNVISDGGEIIPHAVVEHARLSKEYGGAAGTFGAGLAGAARGVSLGLSDPIAIAAAEAVGGGDAAAKMRERLSAYKDVSPVASAVGEVAGIAAPALLSGGSSLLAEGAGLAALPVEGVGALGRLGERGVASLLPELGESLLGRATGKIATKGAGAALEGAVFGAGQEVSESSLGDEQLTGEKLLASMGHGAVIGGMLGGAVGGLGEAAGDALAGVRAKASPYLAKQAGTQAWKALDAAPNVMREAEKRFEGGAAGVGRTLLDLDVIPKDAGLTGAALTPAELLPRVTEKLEEWGGKVGKLIDDSGASIPLRDVHDAIEDVIAPMRGKAGWGKIVKVVEDYRQDLFTKLGAVADEGEVAAGKVAPKLDLPPALEGQRAQFEKVAEAAARGEPEAMAFLDAAGIKRAEAPTELPAKMLLDREVPASVIFQQKRALGDLVYKAVKTLDASLPVEEMRSVYGKMSDLELKAVDGALANREIEGAPKAALREARRNYQALSLAKKGLEGSQALRSQTGALGGYEFMAGVMPGMTALMTGHPLGAIGGAVGAVATRMARARGNAFLAATFDRLSALQTIARKSADIDRDVAAGVKAFVGRTSGTPYRGPTAAEVGSREAATGTESAREEFERRSADVENAAKADHGSAVQPLAAHAPKTAASFAQAAQRATLWLASQIPESPKIGSKTPGDQEVHRWLTQARAVSNPAGTVAVGMAKGNLSVTEVEAIRDSGAYPALMADIQRQIQVQAEKVLATDGKLPYPVRRDLALLFGVPEWSMSADGVRTLQANTQAPAGGKGGDSPQQNAPKRPMPDRSQASQSASEQNQVGQIREK